jgi:hypothetical protein
MQRWPNHLMISSTESKEQTDINAESAPRLDSVTTSVDWSRVERVAFRFLVAYFGVFWLGSAIALLSGPRSRLVALRDTTIGWVGHTVLTVQGTLPPAGRGWAAAEALIITALAVAITTFWSAVATRKAYDRFAGWCRIALRYYVAGMMLIYGGAKVIPTQFPPIDLASLIRPLGELTPMQLLWMYMGASPVYTIFTGLGEWVGAFLLFFRRTTTLGALILVAVLSNVALINYAYDVPVKQLSTNLLIGALALAAADLRRLVGVFLLNAPTAPAKLAFRLSPELVRFRRIVKPTMMIAATGLPLVYSLMIYRANRIRSPLYGVYHVEQFVRNGVVVPAAFSERERWQTVVFSWRSLAAVRSMGDSTLTLDAPIDTTAHRVTMRMRGERIDFSSLSYVRRADTLQMRGTIAGDSVAMTLRRVDERQSFRLLQ